MKLTIAILSLVACMGAHADTATTVMTPSATLNKTCVFGVTNVAFGEYSALNAADQLSSSTVTIKCTKGTGWNYYQYSNYYGYLGDTVAAMLNGTNKLYYQTQVADGSWDNDLDKPGVANLGHYLGTGNGENQVFNISYKIMKNQYVKPGNYIDTVTAYIAF